MAERISRYRAAGAAIDASVARVAAYAVFECDTGEPENNQHAGKHRCAAAVEARAVFRVDLGCKRTKTQQRKRAELGHDTECDEQHSTEERGAKLWQDHA